MGFRPAASGSLSVRLVGAVLAVEILSWITLGYLVSAGSLALTVALLSGVALLYAMSVSGLLLRRRFAAGAWAGAVIVAAGVAYCNLGPLVRTPAAAEVAFLVAAICVPGLAMVGKEALLVGKNRLSLPAVGLLVCLGQLSAFLLQRTWSPTSAIPSWATLTELLYSSGVGSVTLYVIVSGLLRLSLLLAIQRSSASTVQLVNALAVPLGATLLTSGLQHNVQALLLASGGGILYLLAQTMMNTTVEAESLPAEVVEKKAEVKEQRKQDSEKLKFLEELKREAEEEQEQLKKRQDELRRQKEEKRRQQEEEQRRKQEEARKQQQQEERLQRLKERWVQQEERQREEEQQCQTRPEPKMYSDEDLSNMENA